MKCNNNSSRLQYLRRGIVSLFSCVLTENPKAGSQSSVNTVHEPTRVFQCSIQCSCSVHNKSHFCLKCMATIQMAIILLQQAIWLVFLYYFFLLFFFHLWDMSLLSMSGLIPSAPHWNLLLKLLEQFADQIGSSELFLLTFMDSSLFNIGKIDPITEKNMQDRKPVHSLCQLVYLLIILSCF